MTAREELMEWARHNAPALYSRALLEEYVETHGCHYDERYGREAVSRMHSTADGIRREGEHWSFDDVVDAISPHLDLMDETDTAWDAYVAANMWWHDLGKNYAKRGTDDSAVILDALTWAFADEDASDGKLWKYLHAVG